MKKEDNNYELSNEEKIDLTIKLLGIKGKLYNIKNENDILNNIIICNEIKNKLMDTENELLIDFIYLLLKNDSNVPYLFYLINDKNEYENNRKDEYNEDISFFYDNKIKKEIKYLYIDINELNKIKIQDKKFIIEKEIFRIQYDFTKLITGYNLINALGYEETKNRYFDIYEKCDTLENILSLAKEYENSKKKCETFSNKLNTLKRTKILEKLNNLQACKNIAENNIVNTNNDINNLKNFKKYIEGYRDENTNNYLDYYENIKNTYNIESISQVNKMICNAINNLVDFSNRYLYLNKYYEKDYKEVNEYTTNNLGVNLDNIEKNKNIINYFDEIEKELIINKNNKKEKFLNASKQIYDNDDIDINKVKKDYEECIALESYYYTLYDYEYYINKSIDINNVIEKAKISIEKNKDITKDYEKEKMLKFLYINKINKPLDSNDDNSNK